jgi:tetratricopeptide (TPR) repeat protein
VQLIDARSDTHLWAESYERHLSHILDLQAEVAQAIAGQIRIKLTPQEQAQLDQTHSVDPEAYEAYLKGRYHWLRRSREGHAKAVKYFRDAIDKDPACAIAYAGLADALSVMGLWGLLPPEEGCGKAKELAVKALDLDTSLSEAHTSLAWAAAHYDYDFVCAERGFERAIELNPRSAIAHDWFGMTLGMMGRYEEAFTELKRAIRLDPHVSVIHFGMAFVCWCGRHYDQAIAACNDALELDPNSVQGHVWLGLSYAANSEWKLAIAALEKAVELSDGTPVARACLGEAYAAGGFSDRADEILKQLLRHQHVTKYFVSRICAALGRNHEAMTWLEGAYGDHGEWLPLLNVDPRFDGLRSESRVQGLLQRMNLSGPSLTGFA